jgi:hypothetical protein
MKLKILFYDPLEDPKLNSESNVTERIALSEIVKPTYTHTYS